jgi:hypothetical protein
VKKQKILVVVSERDDVPSLPDAMVMTAERYLAGGEASADPSLFVVNLCRTYVYSSTGYYVSLLADARGQRVLPTIETSAGLADPYSRFRALQEAGVATVDEAEMAMRRRTLDLPGVPAGATAIAGDAAGGFLLAVVRHGYTARRAAGARAWGWAQGGE